MRTLGLQVTNIAADTGPTAVHERQRRRDVRLAARAHPADAPRRGLPGPAAGAATPGGLPGGRSQPVQGRARRAHAAELVVPAPAAALPGERSLGARGPAAEPTLTARLASGAELGHSDGVRAPGDRPAAGRRPRAADADAPRPAPAAAGGAGAAPPAPAPAAPQPRPGPGTPGPAQLQQQRGGAQHARVRQRRARRPGAR